MLKLENISVSYGDIEALNGISLEINKGDFLSVIGRNGVGKTTLMKTIIGLLKVKNGNIFYNSEDVTKLPAYKRVRNGIGYVPQGRQIFPKLTVEENLLTGVDSPNPGTVEEVYSWFPVLSEMRQRYGGDLSGGLKQHACSKNVCL